MTPSQLIYVTDPLCLWCYGMAPALDSFYNNLPDELNCITINGGLFPDSRARVTDIEFREYLKNAAQHVTAKTGQVFSKSFWSLLETQGFRYDTEPSARASVVVKSLTDETHMRQFIHALQRAVFIDGINPNITDNLSSIAEQSGIEKGSFIASFNDPTSLEATHNEYALANKMGVQGFPALIYQHQKRAYSLAAGYAPLEELQTALNWARSESNQPTVISKKNTNVCNSQGCSI
ncbi:DsbA family protein [Neptunomonas japonica]|uniref:DsbA family protein n=1 Tax=Neptunomonas japonica TaxID=417574 RepID=UPI000429404A|nr:DsbA family protein [Neptunomonas japonica]